MMVPLVPVIVSQNAYILYIRAPRFGDPVQGTAAGKYASQLLKASCASYAKGLAHCKGPQDRLLNVRYACFVPVVAINKPDFLAGYSFFYESARYRSDFLATIENNRNLR